MKTKVIQGSKDSCIYRQKVIIDLGGLNALKYFNRIKFQNAYFLLLRNF